MSNKTRLMKKKYTHKMSSVSAEYEFIVNYGQQVKCVY